MTEQKRVHKSGDVDVENIMEQIRSEASKRRKNSSEAYYTEKSGSAFDKHNDIPDINTNYLRTVITTAASNSDVGAEVTPMSHFKGITRKIAIFFGKIIVFALSFITDKQRSFNNAVIASLRSIADMLERVNRKSSSSLEELRNSVFLEIEKHKYEVHKTVVSMQQSLEEMRGEFDGITKAINAIITKQEQIDPTISELRNGQDHLLNRSSDLSNAFNDLQRRYEDDSSAFQEKISYLDMSKRERIDDLENTIHSLRSTVAQQERRLYMLLEEARKRLPEAFDNRQLNVFAEEKKHMLDAMYVSFEDVFRGTREDIKKRLHVYLPFMAKISAKDSAVSILDIGCGRGEWLELLKEKGYSARGLDRNKVLIDQCRERSLDVLESDMFDHLKTLPDAALDVLTCFHVIEHLYHNDLILLVDEIVRVLKPGGMVLFESPNAQNIAVGSCNFYTDPTHINPVPSRTMKFITESRGLCHVEVLNLNPSPDGFKVKDSDMEIVKRFNELFYGPQDYAVIGYKV